MTQEIESFLSKLGSMEEFLKKVRLQGFQEISFSQISRTQENLVPGWNYWWNQKILSCALRDCSFLHISPCLIFQPRTIKQLQILVQNADKDRIPLSFASGKTGLSGGFATPFVLIDLEFLQTLEKPVSFSKREATIRVDQAVLVSYLIRYAAMVSEKKLIFPSQPSSAFKLPVRIGGLIGTNASGVTAGKLGPIYDWINELQVMTPQGKIITLTKPNSPQVDCLFNKIIGGMGNWGIVLNALIKLAPAPEMQKLAYSILYGENFDFIFTALQEIQNSQIFPLNSEFIISTERIPGKFAHLDPSKKIKWAILLKDENQIIEKFIQIIHKFGKFNVQTLSQEKYQEYLEERTGLAIQTKSNDPNEEYIRFPGFEDILMPPATLKGILQEINSNLHKFGFPSIVIGYGHLNFRKGQGLLLHIRIPVNVHEYALNPSKMNSRLAQITAKMNYLLEQKYHIRPKAEHSTGMFSIWHERHDLRQIITRTENHTTFISPHLVIFLKICQYHEISFKSDFIQEEAELILEQMLHIYLTGKFPKDPLWILQ